MKHNIKEKKIIEVMILMEWKREKEEKIEEWEESRRRDRRNKMINEKEN